ncbi:hypothetical protein HAX54_022925, partial [Datura stramonium]|nr:hypothetical protein [Datura stramonium]
EFSDARDKRSRTSSTFNCTSSGGRGFSGRIFHQHFDRPIHTAIQASKEGQSR